MDNRHFMVAGVIIALVIGVVAVFFASSDPDGLESTALIVQGDKTLTGATPPDAEVDTGLHETIVYDSPFSNYSIGGPFGTYGGLVAIVLGTFLAFVAVYAIAKVMAGARAPNQ
jgi:cobalt/nickel transport protein